MNLVGVRPSSLSFSPSLLNTTFGGRVESMQLAYVSGTNLNCNHPVASVLQEVLAVDSHDAGLVWLSNISESKIAHLNQVPVVLRLSCIHDDGDYVCSLLGHIEEFSSAPWREFDSVKDTSWADYVRNVRASGSG